MTREKPQQKNKPPRHPTIMCSHKTFVNGAWLVCWLCRRRACGIQYTRWVKQPILLTDVKALDKCLFVDVCLSSGCNGILSIRDYWRMCWGLTKPLPSDVRHAYRIRHYRGRRHYNVRGSSHVDTYGHLVGHVLWLAETTYQRSRQNTLGWGKN